MKVIKVLLVLSFLATLIIYLFPRTWELELSATLQANKTDSSVYFFQFISDSKSFITVGIPVVLLAMSFFKKDRPLREKAFLILFSLALAGIFSIAVKKIVREPRPYEVDRRIVQLSGGGGYGFPSGHTLEAVAATAMISYLWSQWSIILVSIGWVLLVMFSRIYLGVHDPGDVMGGMFLGLLSALIVITIRDYVRRPRSKSPAK
jgi:undecaprenyl-diphosphatase